MLEQALDVFHAMHDDPRAHADVVTYASLISALERCGQWREALDAYESLKEAGLRPNGYIFAPLINACEKGGQWKKAIELFKTMQVGGSCAHMFGGWTRRESLDHRHIQFAGQITSLWDDKD